MQVFHIRYRNAQGALMRILNAVSRRGLDLTSVHAEYAGQDHACLLYTSEQISNGELLAAAEAEGFDLLLTTDKNIRYQQNLAARKIGIVVLGNSTWRVVRLHLDRIAQIVNKATPGSYAEVDIQFE